MSFELATDRHLALDHVATVQAQLDELVRMLESDAHCVDVMKQIQTVQCVLDSANRVTLRQHLETCFSDAMVFGRGQALVDELIDAVQFTPALPGSQAGLTESAPSSGGKRANDRILASTTMSLPGIAGHRCKTAIEAIIIAIAGVDMVDVHVPTKTITIHHDGRAPARRLINALEEQGYHVANAPTPALGIRTCSHDHHRFHGVAHHQGRGSRHGTRASWTSRQPHPAHIESGFVDGDGI